jgi:hypothetical protein
MEFLICLGYGAFIGSIVLVHRARKLGMREHLVNADVRSGKRRLDGNEH